MRKLICFTLAVFLLGTTCFASPNITGKDLSKNIINISGNAKSGDKVSMVIINPGYTYSDVETRPEASLQSFSSYETRDDKYSFDVEINVASDGGGSFLAVINVDGVSEEFTFKFYPIEAKLGIIKEINSADSSQELMANIPVKGSVIDRCLEFYSAYNLPLTSMVNKSTIAQILITQRGNGYPDDADKMNIVLCSSICLAALNESLPQCFENSKLKYPAELGVAELDIYNSYCIELGQNGLLAVKSALMGKNFQKTSSMLSAFKEAVILNLFTNNVKYGSGHIENLLAVYSDELVSHGFNLSKLSSVSNKLKLYDALVSSKAQSLTELASVFNSYNEALSSSQSGGVSSAQSGYNTGSAPLYVPEATPPSSSFADIETVQWANEAITELSKLGIIHGKGNGLFDPYGTVTRAEFTKMLVGALSLDLSQDDCKFTDVTDSWAKPYIATAVSNGIVNGIDDASFAPHSYITREQGAVMCYRGSVMKNMTFASDISVFSDDLSINTWAKEAVYSLASVKIINGTGDGSFAPLKTMTRAETAKLVYGLYCAINNLQ